MVENRHSPHDEVDGLERTCEELIKERRAQQRVGESRYTASKAKYIQRLKVNESHKKGKMGAKKRRKQPSYLPTM